MVSRPPSFCPYCGSELDSVEIEGRERPVCPDEERVIWHNPVPGAGVAVVARRDGPADAVLLVKRARPPGVGEWTIPGGHLELGEDGTEGAVRELREETGLIADPDDLVFLNASALDSIDGKHVFSIGYAVRDEDVEGAIEAGSDADAARFFTPAEFAAFDGVFREYFRERFEAASRRF